VTGITGREVLKGTLVDTKFLIPGVISWWNQNSQRDFSGNGNGRTL